MPRGGRRPGAGAPKNNLNAFKHGHRSPYARALVRALLATPQVRRLLLALLREQSKKRASTVSKSLTFFLNNQKHDTELAKRQGPESL